MPTKRPVDDWQTALERDRAAFVQGWDWQRVLWTWRARLTEFGIELEPVFQIVEVNDPGSDPDREPGLSWWPVNKIEECRQTVLRHFERYPGSIGPLHPNVTMRQGEIDTLNHLWAARNEPDKVAGVLFSGSLFSRMDSSRKGRSLDNWPPLALLRDLQQWAYGAWCDPEMGRGWHYASTSTFPAMSYDGVYTIDSMEALVRYIAEEHAALFSVYRPIALFYGS